MQDTKFNEKVAEAIGQAANQAREGVIDDLEPDQAEWKHLAEYERREMIARAQKVVEALASHYGMTLEEMLAVLEEKRGHDTTH